MEKIKTWLCSVKDRVLEYVNVEKIKDLVFNVIGGLLSLIVLILLCIFVSGVMDLINVAFISMLGFWIGTIVYLCFVAVTMSMIATKVKFKATSNHIDIKVGREIVTEPTPA